MIKDDEIGASGADRERKRERRYWLAIIGPVALALLIGFGFTAWHGVEDIRLGQISPARALLGLFMTGLMLPVALLLHHRVADEQEERAILWSTHVAFVVLVVLGGSWWFLNKALLAPPVDFMALVGATGLIGAFVWLWLKFR